MIPATRSQLAILLSKVRLFASPKVQLEQYATPSEIAADLLWTLHMRKELEPRHLLDLGCGTGILGIGALALSAKKVTFLDIDPQALQEAQKNHDEMRQTHWGESEFILSDALSYTGKADIAIMNPPYGIKRKHADREFLLKAMSLTQQIYSFHKSDSEGFIRSLCKDMGWEVKSIIAYSFPLPHTYAFHTRRIKRIDVSLFCLSKNRLSSD